MGTCQGRSVGIQVEGDLDLRHLGWRTALSFLTTSDRHSASLCRFICCFWLYVSQYNERAKSSKCEAKQLYLCACVCLHVCMYRMYVLCCVVLCCVVLRCIVLYCIVLYCIVLYCIILYCTVLYCTVLYCTVLYCTVLYCTVLCCTVV